jgi:putative membrane protein
MKKIFLFLKGMVVGISNIIPGVSGGTMAVVTNVYDLMVDILSMKIQNIKKRWLEALILVLGMGFGILAFSHLLEFLLTYYAKQCNWFFSGIVIGTVPFLVAKSKVKKPKISTIISFLVMLGIMIVIFIFSADMNKEAGESLTLNVGTFMYMILAGFIGAFSMIVPGISGSFMMVVMGAYKTILSAITDLNLLILLPFGIGAAIGLVVGARVISWLLKRFPEQTYFGILGLIIGSVPTLAGTDGVVLIILLVIGTATSFYFGKSELKE